MSKIRASGAMLTITALQIATASFAVPKSLRKTIAGRAAAVADGFCASGGAQETASAAARRTSRGKRFLWRFMVLPPGLSARSL